MSVSSQNPRAFGLHVLGSYENLRGFFRASPAAAEVLRHRGGMDATIPRPHDAEGAESGCRVFAEGMTHLFKVAHTVNWPNQDGETVNGSRPVPEGLIADPRVKSRVYLHAKPGAPAVSWLPERLSDYRDELLDSFQGKQVVFHHREGICKGECDWFLHLYFRTKDQFSDPRSHMRALGEQFEQGGSREPVLLQSIRLKKGKLLDLKIGVQPASVPGIQDYVRSFCKSVFSKGPQSLIHITPVDWRNREAALTRQLQDLPSGAYQTGLPVHATAYVKIGPMLGYFFDPNRGIVEINGPEQGKELYRLMSQVLFQTGDSSLRHVGVQCYIDVTPVSSRTNDVPAGDVRSLSVESSYEVQDHEDDALQKIWEAVFSQLDTNGIPSLNAPAGEIGDWLEQHADQLGNFEELSLRGKGLVCLPEKVMKLFIGLKRLDLSDNQITELPPGIFAGLPLEELHIFGNPLRECSPEMWGLTPQLTQREVVENTLKWLEDLQARLAHPVN